MAKAAFTGPLLVLGGVAGAQGGAQPREYSDEIGPSLFWGGFAIPGAGGGKDKTGPGTIPCVYAAIPIRTVNCFLSPGAAALTTAGGATSGTPFVNLTAYNVGRAPYTQILGGATVPGIALDMGVDTATFTTGATANVTMAAPSVAANVWRYNKPGLWIALLNGGAAGATLYTQVQSVNATTGAMTVSPAPAAAGTGQVTFTNRYNPAAYGAGAPTGLSSEIPAGTARLNIPEIGCTRGVGVTGVAAGTGGAVLIQGTDGYGYPQSETIAVAAGAGTTWGKKTYDTFISATPQFSDAGHNYTVVTSDFIGLPLSVMSANSLASVLYGAPGAQTAQTSANFTVIPADLTNPATRTTGDVRGGVQVSANGPAVALGLAAPATGITLVATSQLTIQQVLDPLAVALSSGFNAGTLLGVTPV
jgi:hypothetical protein